MHGAPLDVDQAASGMVTFDSFSLGPGLHGVIPVAGSLEITVHGVVVQ